MKISNFYWIEKYAYSAQYKICCKLIKTIVLLNVRKFLLIVRNYSTINKLHFSHVSKLGKKKSISY